MPDENGPVEAPDAQANGRAALSVAVGAAIAALTMAVVATTDVPDQIVAAWSGVALTLWRLGEVAYDMRRARG